MLWRAQAYNKFSFKMQEHNNKFRVLLWALLWVLLWAIVNKLSQEDLDTIFMRNIKKLSK